MVVTPDFGQKIQQKHLQLLDAFGR